MMFGAAGETYVPPLWQVIQSWVAKSRFRAPRSGRPQQARRTVGIVLHVAGGAGILRDRGIGSYVGFGRDIVGSGLVNAAVPSREEIGLPLAWSRLGSWHARHICPLELSRTRNSCAMDRSS